MAITLRFLLATYCLFWLRRIFFSTAPERTLSGTHTETHSDSLPFSNTCTVFFTADVCYFATSLFERFACLAKRSSQAPYECFGAPNRHYVSAIWFSAKDSSVCNSVLQSILQQLLTSFLSLTLSGSRLIIYVCQPIHPLPFLATDSSS